MSRRSLERVLEGVVYILFLWMVSGFVISKVTDVKPFPSKPISSNHDQAIHPANKWCSKSSEYNQKR